MIEGIVSLYQRLELYKKNFSVVASYSLRDVQFIFTFIGFALLYNIKATTASKSKIPTPSNRGNQLLILSVEIHADNPARCMFEHSNT